MVIGADKTGPSTPVNQFTGVIDELEFFNRALASAEIQAIFNADSAGKCKPECTPAPFGLVSWWPGEGNPNDLLNNNPGTLQNGAAFAGGKVGLGFSFDGLYDHVETGDSSSLSITGEISVDAWVRPNALGTSAQAIVTKHNSTRPSQVSYGMQIRPNGALERH